jgi:hypothetical protein
MPSSRLDATRATARGGVLDMLATAGGALLLAFSLLISLGLLLDVIGRYGVGQPFFGPDAQESLLALAGIGFGVASLLGLPAALAAPFRRTGDPPLRSRSALALVPGCVVGLIVLAIAFAALAAQVGAGPAASVTYERAAQTFSGFVFLIVPLALMLGALFGGARTPETTAAAAAPVILVTLCGLMASLSILSLLGALLLPLLAAGIVIACLYAAAPAPSVTPWLAGIALAVGLTLPIATGFFTPSEALGLVAAFAIPITLLVRALALRQPLRLMLRQAAMEMASVGIIMIAAALAGQTLAIAGAQPAITDALGSSPAMLIAVAVVSLGAGYLLTPLLALSLVVPAAFPMLSKAGVEPTLGAAVLVLLGLAAVAARSARGGGANVIGLPSLAAWIAAAAFVALAGTIALVPGIALAPMRVLMQ